MAQKKTLEEIINRSDYQNLTPALIKRTQEVAKLIRNKMVELDIESKELRAEFTKKTGEKVCVRICICSRRSPGNGSYEYLAVRTDDEEERWKSLEDIRRGFYYAGDFNAWVPGASCPNALQFLNVAQDFIRQLGEIEDIKVENVKQVLAKYDKTFDTK